MAKRFKELTDFDVKAATARDTDYKIPDGDGLYLFVRNNGTKTWRFRYEFGGKEKLLTIGPYPDVSLKGARDRAFEARAQLRDGIDPMEEKKTLKAAQVQKKIEAEQAAANQFQEVAREWIKEFKRDWKPSHSDKVVARLEKEVFPWVGKKGVAEITAPELLLVARRIQARGALETAHRTLGYCSQIFRYAIATARAERDPAADLRGALPPRRRKNHLAALTNPKDIGHLLRDIDSYTGSQVVRAAFKLSPYVFVRPGELRHMRWSEIDFEAAEWKYFVTKTSTWHIVPLASQVIEILKEIQPMTGNDKYVFRAERDRNRPISDNAVRSAMRRLGWGNKEMTPHGFRAMASTILDNLGYRQEWIERQLAHEEPNLVKAAYKREVFRMYLPERRTMMQAWADYLDRLRQDDPARKEVGDDDVAGTGTAVEE
jgi:integrase